MTEQQRVLVAITATIASALYLMAIDAVFLHVAADGAGSTFVLGQIA